MLRFFLPFGKVDRLIGFPHINDKHPLLDYRSADSPDNSLKVVVAECSLFFWQPFADKLVDNWSILGLVVVCFGSSKGNNNFYEDYCLSKHYLSQLITDRVCVVYSPHNNKF
jgi:hypothetical protein